MEIVLRINNLTDENRTHKFEAAATEVAKAMKVPATIKKKPGEGKEVYPYRAQEELYQRQMNAFGLTMDDLYSRVCTTVGFVPAKRFSKAIDPNAPKLGKEILWNPETGKPISQKDLDRLLSAVDKYLNKNIKSKGEEMVISQAAVARIISNLRQNGVSFEELKDKPLSSLKTPEGKPWDSISTYVGLLRDFPGDYEGLRFIGDRVMGNHITGIKDNIRSGIVNILDDGFAAGLTRGQMSQMLFDKFGSYNKDWDRLIDTEGVNVFNRQYLAEQTQDAPKGEPVYFIRREFFDNRTCKFCNKAQDGIIAKWVDRPQGSEEIKDPVASIALWAGKSNYGRPQSSWWWAEGAIHPNCFPDDVEVLTDSGWALFKDVVASHKIFAIDPTSREVGFVKHKGSISYLYDGPMIRFSGRNYDLAATPDHNQIYLSRKKKVLKSKRMEELYEMGNVILPRAIGEWRVPKQNIPVCEDVSIDDIAYARLWAWYLSDGSGRASRPGEYQIPQKDRENIIRDIGALITPSGCVKRKYCGLLYEMDGKKCNEKYIPQSVKGLRKEALVAFLDSYSKADGINRTGSENHAGSYETTDGKRGFDVSFFTTSERLAADLGEVIVKAGYFPSYSVKEPDGRLLDFPSGRYKSKLKCYIVRMCKSKYRHFSRSSKSPGLREKYHYHGMVYDVELEKWHFLLVRRNGKVAWSGNCRGSWDRYYPEYEGIEL